MSPVCSSIVTATLNDDLHEWSVEVSLAPHSGKWKGQEHENSMSFGSAARFDCPHIIDRASDRNITITTRSRGLDYINFLDPQKYDRAVFAPFFCAFTGLFEHHAMRNVYSNYKIMDIYLNETEYYCPVFYDVAKDMDVQLVFGGNVYVPGYQLELRDATIKRKTCALIECKLYNLRDKNGQIKTCGKPEHAYKELEYKLPRVFMMCSCAGGKNVQRVLSIGLGEPNKDGEFCDQRLLKETKARFKKLESQLSQCYEAKTKVVNRETRFCFQAFYTENNLTYHLESGALTSKSAILRNHEKTLAQMYKNFRDRHAVVFTDECVEENGTIICFCRASGPNPCNRWVLDVSKITSRKSGILCSSLSSSASEFLEPGSPTLTSCGEDCVHNEGGCFRARWPFLKDDRRPPPPGEGCTSNVAARVWGNTSLRHLQACELESLKERCTVQLRSVADGGPIVVCCCKSVKTPCLQQKFMQAEFGRSVLWKAKAQE
ncbi:hypothetical protein L596_009624 [Steinernema carpocapsae]|uniref:Uncharacterized protein n=1 Tax=Steinernema carpocapsae TaxID=34508 RepID=A0A4U5PG36_STECR|nr:hypothetical protein L596_009624 [Steinernema carpocapsae]